MSKIRLFILVIILGFIYWWFLRVPVLNKPVKPLLVSAAGTSTRQIDESLDVPAVVDDVTDTIAVDEDELLDSVVVEPVVSSYLQLMRDYDLWKLCFDARAFSQLSDALEKYLLISQIQEKTWKLLHDDCLQLSRVYQSEDIKKQLHELLLATATKTKSEANYKQSFKLVQTYRQLSQQAHKPVFVFFNDEIQQLRMEISQYDTTEDDRDYYFLTDSELENLDKVPINIQMQERLSALLKSNEDQYMQTLQDYQDLHQQLLERLISSYAYEYTLIFDNIDSVSAEFSDLIGFDYGYTFDSFTLQNLTEKILASQQFSDKEYLALILPATMQLFACYKGVDCDKGSHLAIKLCLGLDKSFAYRGADSKACHEDVQRFIYANYLTDNQLLDVNTVFAQIVENYDKE